MSRKTKRNENHIPDPARLARSAVNRKSRLERGFVNRHEESINARRERHERTMKDTEKIS